MSSRFLRRCPTRHVGRSAQWRPTVPSRPLGRLHGCRTAAGVVGGGGGTAVAVAKGRGRIDSGVAGGPLDGGLPGRGSPGGRGPDPASAPHARATSPLRSSVDRGPGPPAVPNTCTHALRAWEHFGTWSAICGGSTGPRNTGRPPKGRGPPRPRPIRPTHTADGRRGPGCGTRPTVNDMIRSAGPVRSAGDQGECHADQESDRGGLRRRPSWWWWGWVSACPRPTHRVGQPSGPAGKRVGRRGLAPRGRPR